MRTRASIVHPVRIKVIAALIAAVAVLAGCSGTASSSGFRVVTSSPTSAEPGEPIGTTLDTAALTQQTRQAMRDADTCEVTITGGDIQAHGQMRLRPGRVGASLEVLLSGKTIAIRLVSGSVYMDVHELLPDLKWVKVGPKFIDALPSALRSLLLSLRYLSNPGAFHAQSAFAGKTFIVVRHETVHGSLRRCTPPRSS